jgi:hypothetical protein
MMCLVPGYGQQFMLSCSRVQYLFVVADFMSTFDVASRDNQGFGLIEDHAYISLRIFPCL